MVPPCTCALPLQHDETWHVQERGGDVGRCVNDVGAIVDTDRQQGVGRWLWRGLLESTYPRSVNQLLP